MGLSEKDTKLLWARSAALCAFPDCQENLQRITRSGGLYHIGEQAHMKAKSLSGPRGSADIGEFETESYENYVLLCPTCHTTIDKAPTDFPVDLLRQFKEQHESWVAETLLPEVGRRSPTTRTYMALLEEMERLLHWGDWDSLISKAWRDMLPGEVVQHSDALGALKLRAIWPRTKPNLERAMGTAMDLWLEYVNHFTARAHFRNAAGGFLRFERRQFGGIEEQFADDAEESTWSNRNGKLLVQYVAALNDLVKVVRRELDPLFRQESGWFLISDYLGYRSNMESTVYRPMSGDDEEDE